MKKFIAITGVVSILAISACTKSDLYSGPALPPTGLKATGSAGTSGGAASAPAGTGVVGKTAY